MKPSEMTIFAGVTRLDDEKKKIYTVDYMKPHEDFNITLYNDIGLIHVSEPIESNDRIQPIALQNKTFNEVNVTAVLSGWGLREVKIFINFLYI